MIKTDFHIHTRISVDSTAHVNDMVQRAIDCGFTEIALTDHLDYNPADEGYGRYDSRLAYEQTLAARALFGDRIGICHGVEIGEPHLYASKIRELYPCPFDVIIGSIHFVGEHGVHADLFDVRKPADAIRCFFDYTLAMVREGDFDILGHLDYFDRYTLMRNLPPYRPEDYESQIREILKVTLERNITLEVNVSGWRSKADRCFPHPQVLDWYFQMGGRKISIGSDSHLPEHIGMNFGKVTEILLTVGFREYHVFRGRKPMSVPLAE